ncbi:MAG TPA: DUF1844 domain-containing protein [Candidatus Poseidoniaceae archaeon]|nr:MAG TPA: DUF1844 domain-containing protein [Candidatus Poseidoniales archaeon]HII11140.1 DUF1844 domain-containing protein [Candidatus Poseidoniaceae archaeon]|tara:strand:- start:519 stop:896 length:378 start_codon:yes stop_codon:yes gene_type:complete
MSETFKDEETEQLFQLVHMFQRSALLHMGMLPDNEGNLLYNLAEAKAGIDMLQVLQNKTKGNITEQEERMFRGIVSELQLQFLKAPNRRRVMEDTLAESETVRETFANPQSGPVEDLSTSKDGEE